MMDHLDKLDYAFLGFSVAGFLLCVVAMRRQKPRQQIDAHLPNLSPNNRFPRADV